MSVLQRYPSSELLVTGLGPGETRQQEARKKLKMSR